MDISEQEKAAIRAKAQNFVKRLHLGKIVLWLIVFLPLFELFYLWQLSH